MNLRQLYLKTVNKSIAFFGGRKNSDRFIRFHGRSGTSFFSRRQVRFIEKSQVFQLGFLLMHLRNGCFESIVCEAAAFSYFICFYAAPLLCPKLSKRRAEE